MNFDDGNFPDYSNADAPSDGHANGYDPGDYFNATDPPRDYMDESKTSKYSEPYGTKRFSRLDDLLQEPEPDEFVEGMIGAGSPSMLIGPTMMAKTFLINHLIRATTTHTPFFGRYVQEGCVVYVPYEAETTYRYRMLAQLSQMDEEQERLFKERCVVLKRPLPLVPGKEYDLALRDITVNAACLAEETGVPCRLAVIDTAFAALPGVSLKDDNIVTHLINNTNRISMETGAVGMVVHHPGYSNQQRGFGSSAQGGGLNTIFRIERVETDDSTISVPSNARRRIVLDKYKEGDPGVTIGEFDLAVIEVGTNKRGKPITSCCVNELEISEPSAGAATPKSKKMPTGTYATAYEKLQQLDDDHAKSVCGNEIGKTGAQAREMWRVMELKAWRRKCRDDRLTAAEGDLKEIKKHEDIAFDNAVRSLQGTHKLIDRYGGYVWIIERNRSRSVKSVDPVNTDDDESDETAVSVNSSNHQTHIESDDFTDAVMTSADARKNERVAADTQPKPHHTQGKQNHKPNGAANVTEARSEAPQARERSAERDRDAPGASDEGLTFLNDIVLAAKDDPEAVFETDMLRKAAVVFRDVERKRSLIGKLKCHKVAIREFSKQVAKFEEYDRTQSK